MKCDELKEYYYYEDRIITPATHIYRVYHADKVDAAIAELKARIQLDDDEMEGFLQLEEECGGGDLRNYIAELKAELAEKDKDIAYWREEYDKETQLTDALKDEIESLKASHYAEMVDAGMRERKLKRALWIARANSAEWQFLYWCARFAEESGFTKVNICDDPVNTKLRLRTIGEWIETWKNVRTKCRAKAEGYK